MHRILARRNQTAIDFIVKSQRSLLASTPAGPEPPTVSPSSSSVKTGDITAIDLAAQLAEVEQERVSVIDLLEKDTCNRQSDRAMLIWHQSTKQSWDRDSRDQGETSRDWHIDLEEWILQISISHCNSCNFLYCPIYVNNLEADS